jgi:hypothetical protein
MDIWQRKADQKIATLLRIAAICLARTEKLKVLFLQGYKGE